MQCVTRHGVAGQAKSAVSALNGWCDRGLPASLVKVDAESQRQNHIDTNDEAAKQIERRPPRCAGTIGFIAPWSTAFGTRPEGRSECWRAANDLRRPTSTEGFDRFPKLRRDHRDLAQPHFAIGITDEDEAVERIEIRHHSPIATVFDFISHHAGNVVFDRVNIDPPDVPVVGAVWPRQELKVEVVYGQSFGLKSLDEHLMKVDLADVSGHHAEVGPVSPAA